MAVVNERAFRPHPVTCLNCMRKKSMVGDGLGRLNPNPWPEGLKGMQVYRFDHVLLYGPKIIGDHEDFYGRARV